MPTRYFARRTHKKKTDEKGNENKHTQNTITLFNRNPTIITSPKPSEPSSTINPYRSKYAHSSLHSFLITPPTHLLSLPSIFTTPIRPLTIPPLTLQLPTILTRILTKRPPPLPLTLMTSTLHTMSYPSLRTPTTGTKVFECTVWSFERCGWKVRRRCRWVGVCEGRTGRV